MKHNLLQGDKVIWAIFILLCIISVVEVSSAGSYLVLKEGSFAKPMIQQATYVTVALSAAWVLHHIPCRIYKAVMIFGNLICVPLLIYALLNGQMLNNGARWVSFLGLFNFQPSELSKGVLVITAAAAIASWQKDGRISATTFNGIVLCALVHCGLIVTQNFSTAAIIFAGVNAMFVLYRPPRKAMIKTYGILAGLFLFAAISISFLPKDPDAEIYKNPLMHRVTTWRSRVSGDKKIVMTPDPKDFEVTDGNRQVVNARIAVARSHGTGVLPGRSVQRDYLSAAYSDFIYAIIAEELGLGGCILVVMLYLWLLFRCGRIASQTDRVFPAAVAMGFAIMLVGQALINMAVAVGLGPVTGQPLPLISKGGTATIITGAYIGIILSASRTIKRKRPDDAAAITDAPDAITAAEFTKD
jgi:hypothetical protein